MFSFTHHCDNGLDGVGGGLFPAGLLDEAGAEVLDVERHALYHRLAHRRPILGQLWKEANGKSGLKLVRNSEKHSTHHPAILHPIYVPMIQEEGNKLSKDETE